MAKLRSDSAWSKLTAEQRGKLESWLFEKHLGYREALELARSEFGLKTSLTSLKMYAQRLKSEREAREMTRELEDLMTSGGELAKTPEQVRAAGELMAVLKMFELTMAGPGTARELAALLRVMVEGQKTELERRRLGRVLTSVNRRAEQVETPHESG
jgi:hypothetical protein